MVQQQQHKLEKLSEESGYSFPSFVQDSIQGSMTSKDVTNRECEIMVLNALQKLNTCVEQMDGFRGTEDNTNCIEPFVWESVTTRQRKQMTRYHFNVPSHRLAIQTPSWTWYIYWKMANLALLNKYIQDLRVNLWVNNPGSSLGSGTQEPGD